MKDVSITKTKVNGRPKGRPNDKPNKWNDQIIYPDYYRLLNIKEFKAHRRFNDDNN